MTQTVIGIFNNRADADQAVERLTSSGFERNEIDISSGAGVADTRDESTDDGLGDKINRFFNNLFDSEDESSRYTTRARTGTLVTVHTESPALASQASSIMDECGAVDVDNDDYRTNDTGHTRMTMDQDNEPNFGASVSPGTPLATFDDTTSSAGSDVGDDENTTRSIPVVEEDVEIGKREVERGGVRIRSRIIERPVEETLRLREEHVTVNRTPADRPATESDLNSLQEGSFEVRERSEIPVVNKQARVVEEINIRKDVRERDETLRETVRSTDVQVENLESGADEDSGISSNTRKRK